MHPDRLARVPKGARPEFQASKAPKTPKIPAVPAIPKKSLFDDASSDLEDGGAKLQVNEEYAKRFEHNKKREERQRRMFILPSSPPTRAALL